MLLPDYLLRRGRVAHLWLCPGSVWSCVSWWAEWPHPYPCHSPQRMRREGRPYPRSPGGHPLALHAHPCPPFEEGRKGLIDSLCTVHTHTHTKHWFGSIVTTRKSVVSVELTIVTLLWTVPQRSQRWVPGCQGPWCGWRTLSTVRPPGHSHTQAGSGGTCTHHHWSYWSPAWWSSCATTLHSAPALHLHHPPLHPQASAWSWGQMGKVTGQERSKGERVWKSLTMTDRLVYLQLYISSTKV